MPIEIRLQRCAEQLAKDRYVKCRCLPRTTDRRLQRLRRAIDHPSERPTNRGVSRLSKDVLRHGAVRHRLEPSPVQSGKQHAGVTVADVGLSPGRLRQPPHDGLRHAAGTVTAAREPHRVVALVVRDVDEGLGARFVIAREMAVRSKALGVEEDLRRPVRIQRSGQRPHSHGNFGRHARSRRDHADPALFVAHSSGPRALHLIGNACSLRRCLGLEITFSAASAVAA